MYEALYKFLRFMAQSTALHTPQGNLDMVSALLDYGADVSPSYSGQESARLTKEGIESPVG
jgi:hypothetical protein